MGVAHLVRGFLGKNEALAFDPQSLCKMPGMMAVIPIGAKESEQEARVFLELVTMEAASVAESMSSLFSKGPFLKYTVKNH